MEKELVLIKDKYALTVNEAAAYFNVGVKRIRRLLTENPNQFSINCGNKRLIIRHKLEKYFDEISEL